MARELAQWFVMIAGVRTGPITRAELGLQAESGAINGRSHVWKQGMPGWQRGAEVEELSALFAPESAPPEPAKSSPPRAGIGAKSKAASAKPGALKPVASYSSGGPSPSRNRGVPAQAPGSRKTAFESDDSSKGMRELDTGHFKLAEENAHDDGTRAGSGKPGEGQSVFDTNHFRLADAALQKEASRKQAPGAAGGPNEFDTNHFRLAELERQKQLGLAHEEPNDTDLDLNRVRAPATDPWRGVSRPPSARGEPQARELAGWASDEMKKNPPSGKKSGGPNRPASVGNGPANGRASAQGRASALRSPGPSSAGESSSGLLYLVGAGALLVLLAVFLLLR